MSLASKVRVVRTLSVILAAILGCTAGPLGAQEAYPSKGIRLVVPFGAGGITDVVGRLVAQRLGEELKQSIVVDNKAGAGGSIGALAVAQAAPDGYTLLLGTVGTQVVNQMISAKLPYDPAALVPVSLVSNSPYVLAVAGLPDVRDLAGLAEQARRHPGKLNFGSAGYGASPHLAIELFKLITKTRIEHVPFKSGAEAVNAAVSHDVQIVCDAIPVVMPQVKAGRLEALAITAATRATAAPDLRTSAEQGMPDLQIGSWNAIVVPAGTPQDRIDRLSAALARVLARQDVIDRFAELGIEPLPAGAAAYQDHARREVARWRPVVEAANIRLD
jgi:tripartite-type tricarboxylate transporter receptor subunit TctC